MANISLVLALLLCCVTKATVWAQEAPPTLAQEDPGWDSNSMTLALTAVAMEANDSLASLADGCQGQLADMRKAVAQRELWALKMVDASGAPGPGFLWGNVFWLGAVQQCLDLRKRKPIVLKPALAARLVVAPGSLPPFDVHFVVATLSAHAPKQLRVELPNEDVVFLGLCLPRACSPAPLRPLLTSLLAARPLGVQHLYDVSMTLSDLRTLEDTASLKTEPKVILLAVMIVTLLGLVAVGTFYDVMVVQPRMRDAHGHKESHVTSANGGETVKVTSLHHFKPDADTEKPERAWWRYLACFSAWSNAKLLLSGPVGEGAVGAVHGLRFLTMIWIILIHTSFYVADFLDNKPYAYRMVEDLKGQTIMNATFSTDTYFVLSGFLVAYQYTRGKKTAPPPRSAKVVPFRQQASEFCAMLAKRYLRLTPAYMAVLLVVDVNMSWYARTALVMPVERPDLLCSQYWWRNLLYINNLFPGSEMCMSWSWFLADDMQFFVIGSFLVILANTRKVLSGVLLVALVTGSWLLTGYISYSRGYIMTVDAMYNSLDAYYYPPWVRVGPYLVGVAAGYLVVRLDGKLGLGKFWVWALWALGASCNLWALFGLYERDMSVEYAAVYLAVARTAWGAGIAWILVACCTGRAGVVGHILSYRGWVPWSRLTYCAYLINPMLITSVFLNGDRARHLDFYNLSVQGQGFIVLSYLCAFIVAVVVETPCILMLKQLTERREPASRRSVASSLPR